VKYHCLQACLCVAAMSMPAPTSAAAADPAPERVVSINLCTDQLALMIAAEGQLVSVSRLAADPDASNLPEAAARLPLNSGEAEEVFLFEPDLVLAGTFTSRVMIDMLRRLGIRVETFPPVKTLEEVSETVLRFGTLLGRDEPAQALVEEYETELRRLETEARDLPRDRAAFYYANSYTSGSGTLSDEILDRANLDNAAAARGLEGPVRLPLEVMVMERPFLVRTSHISGKSPAMAYATLTHPALQAASGREAIVEERWQVCGTPFVTSAIEALIAARRHVPPD
jgi:iron complex transport system substrate-binding protein